jgi:hypothetical protein
LFLTRCGLDSQTVSPYFFLKMNYSYPFWAPWCRLILVNEFTTAQS